VLGDVVVVVPEAVAAAGNCHLRRGLLGIGPASVRLRDGEQRETLLAAGGGFWVGATACKLKLGGERPSTQPALIPSVGSKIDGRRRGQG
jgi:hypothetical protein